MFDYPKDVKHSKEQLFTLLEKLQIDGYEVTTESFIIDSNYSIDKIIINKTTRILNRVVLSSGLHGIEGYIGHVCQMHFLEHILPDLDKHTQVILYHIINPYGMDHYRRSNRNNIDLNRNYSKNGFSSKNSDFLKVHKILAPRRFRSVLLMNLWFYTSVIRNAIRHSVKSMNTAILKGQKIDNMSIYYSGIDYERSTLYILSELPKLYSYVDEVVWLDIHSGYGKKYQMSMINSRFEKELTKELKETLQYKDIIGYENDPMYDTDGDITEKLYDIHQQDSYQSNLLALCLEFGTLGDGILNTLKSFKSILFDNGAHFYPTNNHVSTYARKLMKKTFLPNTNNWKNSAITKYDKAVREVMQFKKLM